MKQKKTNILRLVSEIMSEDHRGLEMANEQGP